MSNPRNEFPCNDDGLCNRGYTGEDWDWDDVRLAFPRYPDDEDIEEDNDNDDAQNTEQEF